VDYIKRVVGVPGDEVAYLNKQLRINGQVVTRHSLPEFFDESAMRYFNTMKRWARTRIC
jgi:signal peptidase I